MRKKMAKAELELELENLCDLNMKYGVYLSQMHFNQFSTGEDFYSIRAKLDQTVAAIVESKSSILKNSR